MARQCWDEARHVEISCKLADHMGSEIGEFAEQTLLYEAACNPDPVLRLTGVNRALEGLAIDVFKTMKDFGATLQRPGARVLRGLDAGRRGHPREDGLRLAAPPHRQRSRAPEAGPRLPEGRRQAVQLRRLPRRGGREPGAPGPQLPPARRLHRRRDRRARRHRRRGLRRGAGPLRRPRSPRRSAAAVRPVLLDLHTWFSWFVIVGNGLAGAVGPGCRLAAGAAHPRAVVVHRP